MKILCLSFLIILLAHFSFAQPQEQADKNELLKKLSKAKEDTARARLLDLLSDNCVQNNLPDEAINYAQQALALGMQLKNQRMIAESNACLGIGFYTKSDLNNGLNYLLKSFDTTNNLLNRSFTIKVLAHISYIY